MKKFSLIALLLVLSMVFFGCPADDDGGDGAEDIVLTAFADADKADSYDAAYAGGVWTFYGNTGQVSFAIGEKIDVSTYSKVVIEGTSTGTTGMFTVKLIDSENTIVQYNHPVPSQVTYNNTFTNGIVEIPITLIYVDQVDDTLHGTGLADLIAFENVYNGGGTDIGSDVALTITKVTFVARE